MTRLNTALLISRGAGAECFRASELLADAWLPGVPPRPFPASEPRRSSIEPSGCG